MNNIKIGRILIKNFKHISELELDFSEKDIIVLDGPNGFGKTTVFDAIELCITGKISRIVNTMDARSGYNNILYSGDENEDTIIKIEFITDNELITICKRIDSSREYNPKFLRPDNFSIFETYILDKFEDDFSVDTKITSEYREDTLKIQNLDRIFNLFYYVQQEDNISFLKQNVKERMRAIDFLFDTQKENNELDKFEEIFKKIQGEISQINNASLPKLKTKKRTILNSISEVDSKTKERVVYDRLLKNTEEVKMWDKENVIVNSDNRKKFLEEIQNIHNLKSRFNSFVITKINKEIHFSLKNEKLINDFLYLYNFIDKIEVIKKLDENLTKVNKIKSKLSKDKIKQNLINEEIFLEAKIILGEESKINIKSIKDDLQEMLNLKSKMNEVSDLITNLQDTRKILVDHFNNTIKKSRNTDENSCPLCGTQFDSNMELINSIKDKEKLFNSMIDIDGIRYNTLFENFLDNHANNTIEELNNFLLRKENLIDEDFIETLKSAEINIDRMKKFEIWLKSRNMSYLDFLNKSYSIKFDIKEKEKFIEYLNNSIKKEDLNYVNYAEDLETFKSFFNSNEKLVRELKFDDILNKKNYIDHLYYHSNSDELIKVNEEILKVNNILEAKTRFKEKIGLIITEYREQILSHRSKIIKDIEIPFYIYTGKIIQNYQRGCGVFISENEKVSFEGIKFISSSQIDHDVVNFLSSGQLSGLIIAFTMALNKVYGESKMNLLLIDDPVQTLDEINIASLIELLRNDFKNRQFILSTHEREVSNYIRYKFSKYNKATMRLNIKDVIYN